MRTEPQYWRTFEPLQPIAEEDFFILEEEYSTGLEAAQTFVRFECPGLRLEFVRESA